MGITDFPRLDISHFTWRLADVEAGSQTRLYRRVLILVGRSARGAGPLALQGFVSKPSGLAGIALPPLAADVYGAV